MKIRLTGKCDRFYGGVFGLRQDDFFDNKHSHTQHGCHSAIAGQANPRPFHVSFVQCLSGFVVSAYDLFNALSLAFDVILFILVDCFFGHKECDRKSGCALVCYCSHSERSIVSDAPVRGMTLILTVDSMEPCHTDIILDKYRNFVDYRDNEPWYGSPCGMFTQKSTSNPHPSLLCQCAHR